MNGAADVVARMIPIAGIAMVVLIVWFGERRKEKESLHRTELLRKIAESQGDASQRVLEMIRQQDYQAQVRRREGLKLGGLITAAVGIGVTLALAMLDRDKPTWIIGVVPLLIGLALFVYVSYLAPKPSRE